MNNKQSFQNTMQLESDIFEKTDRIPIIPRDGMNREQLLESLTQAETDLFEIMGRMENILGFFQKSLEQKNYDLEEEAALPKNTSNTILNLGKKLSGICQNLPMELPSQSSGQYLENFRNSNARKVLKESWEGIKKLSSNEIQEINNENDEDLFM